MSSNYSSANCDVKMQDLVKYIRALLYNEMCGGNFVVMNMGCDWAIAMRGEGVLGA